MTLTDAQCLTLLRRLDEECRKQPYPPQGLPIFGPTSQADMYCLLVREWYHSIQPESQR